MVGAAKLKNPGTLVVPDMIESRLELAKKTGADVVLNPGKEDVVARVKELSGGYGCDAYIEAASHPVSVTQGLSMIRKLGRFVKFSVFNEPTTVDWSIIGDRKELDIYGAHLGPHTYPLHIDPAQAQDRYGGGSDSYAISGEVRRGHSSRGLMEGIRKGNSRAVRPGIPKDIADGAKVSVAVPKATWRLRRPDRRSGHSRTVHGMAEAFGAASSGGTTLASICRATIFFLPCPGCLNVSVFYSILLT
jgi:hypothetical protein